MRAILQRASYLFWQYPVLWVPVIVADVLKFWLETAGKHFAHVAWFAMLHRSVLDGSIQPPTGAEWVKISLVGGFLERGSNFVGIALYCCALGVMTRMISSSGADAEIGRLRGPLPRRWMRCSVLVCLAFVVAMLSALFITTYCVPSLLHGGQPNAYWSGIVFIFLAGFLAALPVRSFIASNLSEGSPGAKYALKNPIIYSYEAIGVFSVVYFAFWQVMTLLENNLFRDKPILKRHFFSYPIWSLDSLITSVPFIFLMIVLILIRQREAQESTSIPPVLDSSIDVGAKSF